MSKTVWGPLYYMILKRSTVSDWPRPLFEVRGCASVQTCVYKSVPVCLWNEPGFILSIYIYIYIGMCCVFVLMKQLFYTRSWESLQLKKTVSCWRQLFNDIFVFNWLTALVFFLSNVHIRLFCSMSVFVFWIVGWIKQAVGIWQLLGKGTIFWHFINKQLIYNEDKTARFMDTVKKMLVGSNSQAFFFLHLFMFSWPAVLGSSSHVWLPQSLRILSQ